MIWSRAASEWGRITGPIVRVGRLLVGVHDPAAGADAPLEQGLHQRVATEWKVGSDPNGVGLVVRSQPSRGRDGGSSPGIDWRASRYRFARMTRRARIPGRRSS